MKTTKEIMSTINPAQLLEDANTAINNEQYYQAMNLVNSYLLTDPTNLSARLKKGLCYLYLNQAKKAAYMFDQVLAEDEHNPEALACYAEFFKLNLDYDTASHYISAAIAVDEDNSTFHRMAAEIAYLKNDRESAYGMINRAIILSPFKEELYYWRALILNSFKKTQVAINDLTRALTINPQYVEALKLRAKIRMYNGTFDDAVKDLKLAQRFEHMQEIRLKRVA